jgi:hypothetical protein
MKKPQIRIAELDGTVIDREMTNEEFADYKIMIEKSNENAVAKEAQVTAKAALLERLGITAEEAKLLLS